MVLLHLSLFLKFRIVSTMENKFLSLMLSASIFVIVFGGSYYFFGTDHATTEKTYYEKTNEETSYSEESEEGLSQESYKSTPSDPYAPTLHPNAASAVAPGAGGVWSLVGIENKPEPEPEPEIQRSFTEPVTEYLKSNYTPSQIKTLVERGAVSLVCKSYSSPKLIIVDPSLIYHYNGDTGVWKYWDSLTMYNMNQTQQQVMWGNYTSEDANCELYDINYTDLDLQLHIDAINDGIQ